jgi:hypothetical protein
LLSAATEGVIEELEEMCFCLIVERETLALIQRELEQQFPDYNFSEVKNCLWHMDRAFGDVYFPPSVKKHIANYVAQNNVDTANMPWFCRPTVSEMPILLQCEVDQVEAEVLCEMAEKEPVAVPPQIVDKVAAKMKALLTQGKTRETTIYFAPDEMCLAADSQSFDKAAREIPEKDNWENPLWKDEQGNFSIAILDHTGKIWCEVYSKGATSLTLSLEGAVKKEISKKGPYLQVILGTKAEMTAALTIKVCVDGHLQWSDTWSFQEKVK